MLFIHAFIHSFPLFSPNPSDYSHLPTAHTHPPTALPSPPTHCLSLLTYPQPFLPTYSLFLPSHVHTHLIYPLPFLPTYSLLPPIHLPTLVPFPPLSSYPRTHPPTQSVRFPQRASNLLLRLPFRGVNLSWIMTTCRK